MNDTAHLSPRMRTLYASCEQTLARDLRLLPDKPEESATGTLCALWHLAAGVRRSIPDALATPLRELDGAARDRLRDLLRRRAAGEPLAYLTGRQRFMGVDLLAARGALIPRKETELLGYAALEALRALAQERGSATVLDVCTGSGNLALALALYEPRARVWGADLSGAAVELARKNAAHTALGDRVTFVAGDFLTPFESAEFLGRVDLVVCNPPYISTAKVGRMPDDIIGHEPRLAFDGGPLGIRFLDRLVKEASRYLRQGGWLAFEVGLGQSRGLRRRLQQQRFDELRTILDAKGNERALLAHASDLRLREA